MSVKSQLRTLERELRAGDDQQPTADDFRAGLQYFERTGFVPPPNEFPKLSKQVYRAKAMLALARTGKGTGTERDLEHPPKGEDIPDSLSGMATYRRMGGYPGDYDNFDQGNWLWAYRRAHGSLGQRSDWDWADLRPRILDEFFKDEA